MGFTRTRQVAVVSKIPAKAGFDGLFYERRFVAVVSNYEKYL